MRTDPGRFDRVLEHPEYGSAPTEPVLPADAGIGVAAMIVSVAMSTFGLVFLLIGITLLLALKAPLLFTLAIIGAATLVMVGGMRMLGELIRYRNAPIERVVAVVVKERSEVSGGDGSSPASTAYFTTLQLRDGTRAEYHTSRSLVGRVAVDDIGVAYVKARALVEFIRFDVD